MFQTLVSHNADLARLVRRGYAVGFDSNCLVVRDLPYLDELGQLRIGALVARLEFIDLERVTQTDHQAFFAGGVPHEIDGKPISNLGGGACTFPLSEACVDVVVQRSFSNKPKKTGRYDDFFHKVETYVAIISGPAMERYPDVNPYTFRSVDKVVQESVFKFHDTLTTLAGLSDLTRAFNEDVVAVIGAGGTGSYILDFLVKTPVREIRVFDDDTFRVHNVYRAPGKVEEHELGAPKVTVYEGRYSTFRHGLKMRQKRIDATSDADLDGVTFAFVSVDQGTSRAGIVELLIRRKIPFIDVGLGLSRKQGPLSGMVRVTYFAPDTASNVRDMNLVELVDRPDDLYRENIQIAELNALNACLAVLKFKQLRRFYVEGDAHFHTLFCIDGLSLAHLTQPAH